LHRTKNWLKIQLLDINTVGRSPEPRPTEAFHDSTAPSSPPANSRFWSWCSTAIARTGAPPTRAEIAAELGFKSANAAEEHLQALARKGVIELVSGTSRGIRLRSAPVRSLRRADAFSLPLPGLAQLALPLIGRVAAGSPILAQEHVDQTYHLEPSLFQHKPDYLLRCAACPCATPASWTATCWPCSPRARPAMARSWWRAWAMTSPSSAFAAEGPAIELHAENPDYPTIVVQPGEPFEIEGLAVGLIRNTMLM
jgi:repressor LexA